MAPMLPAFQPGQLRALANDLNAGFGGGVKDWKQDLRNTFDPTRMKPFDYTPGKGGNKGGNGKNDGRPNPMVNPGAHNPGPNQNPSGFTPMRPQNAQSPMMLQAQAPGLLGSMMPMQAQQMQQQSGLLGTIPPEVLQFIAQGRR